jgi:hypothetical protein
MNTPTPIDPDELRARLAQAVEPVKPAPDALVQIRAGVRRRRRLQWTLGSGAGAIAAAGAAAAVIGIGSLGHPTAAPRTVAPGASETLSVTPTPVAPSSAALPSATPPTGAAPVVTSATHSSATTASVSSTPVGRLSAPVAHDVDGDGRPDTATTVFAPGADAHLVLHLASGTVTGPTLSLVKAFGSGVTTLTDVNGDGRSEIMVKGVGATGTPYYLFQYLNGALVQVPSLTGAPTDTVLFSGGGGGGGGDFGCVAGRLAVTHYGVEAKTASAAPNDRRYDVTVQTLTLVDGHLVVASQKVSTGTTQAQMAAVIAEHSHNRCGAAL